MTTHLVRIHTHIRTHGNTSLWRELATGVAHCWSKGRGEGEREAIFVHKPSFEDGRYGDRLQIWWLMKGRRSAAASTHTHTDTLTHLLHSRHLQTAQHCSTASEDARLTNQRPRLTHTSEPEPIGASFPPLHYQCPPIRKRHSRCVWKIWANQRPDCSY